MFVFTNFLTFKLFHQFEVLFPTTKEKLQQVHPHVKLSKKKKYTRLSPNHVTQPANPTNILRQTSLRLCSQRASKMEYVCATSNHPSRQGGSNSTTHSDDDDRVDYSRARNNKKTKKSLETPSFEERARWPWLRYLWCREANILCNRSRRDIFVDLGNIPGRGQFDEQTHTHRGVICYKTT